MYRVSFSEGRNGKGELTYAADFDPEIDDAYGLRSTKFPNLLKQVTNVLTEYNMGHSVVVSFENGFPEQHRITAKKAFTAYAEADDVSIEF